MSDQMNFGIGALSSQTGVKIETIRYYEKQGLLPAPPRTPGGHRTYHKDHLRRLTFIRRSRELGFSMAEVRGLLELVDGSSYSCDEIKTITLDHAKAVKKKIADLRRLQKSLVNIASQCKGGKAPDCPIIDALLTPD